MTGQKFKIKATLDNQNTKSLEFNRGAKLNLGDLKSGLERLFGVGALGLRYRFGDGRIQPIYQDFHVLDAVKDCEKNGLKYITILVNREGGSSSYNTASAPVRTTTTQAPAPQSYNAPKPAATQSSATGSSTGAKKFCEECGASLPNNVRFCPECGRSLPEIKSQSGQSQSVSQSQPVSQPQPSKSTSSSGETLCSGCGNALSGTAVKALEKSWHKECFVCISCHKSLASGGFLEDSGGNPICSDCFDTRFSKRCFKCSRNIDGAYLSVEGHEYHRTCFVCSNCSATFDGGYFMKEGRPFCKSCV